MASTSSNLSPDENHRHFISQCGSSRAVVEQFDNMVWVLADLPESKAAYVASRICGCNRSHGPCKHMKKVEEKKLVLVQENKPGDELVEVNTPHSNNNSTSLDSLESFKAAKPDNRRMLYYLTLCTRPWGLAERKEQIVLSPQMQRLLGGSGEGGSWKLYYAKDIWEVAKKLAMPTTGEEGRVLKLTHNLESQFKRWNKELDGFFQDEVEAILLEILKNLTEMKLLQGVSVVHELEMTPLDYPQVWLASDLGQILSTIERLHERLIII